MEYTDDKSSLPAKALGGPEIPLEPGQDARAILLQWMLSPDNPFFARAFVNRIWGHYFGIVLAGGGIRRGSVYGSTDAKCMDPDTAACSPDDVAATIFHCLGLDPTQELTTPTNRPVQLFREGKVLHGILG